MESKDHSGYTIRVKGEIVVKSQKHYAQDWMCKSVATEIDEDNVKFEYDPNTHTVISDLILGDTIRAVPYASYLSDKDITCYLGNGADIYACTKYNGAYYYYKEFINTVETQLEYSVKLRKKILPVLNKALFMDVFSILELFLSDLLLCLIYTNTTIYEKAINFYKLDKKADENEIIRNIELKMHRFFFQEVIYHRFNKVRKIFIDIVGVNIPDYKKLKDYLHKRNNIVHRYSYSNIDRMRIITITKEDVQGLIDTANAFVEELMINVNEHFDKSN